MSLDLISSLDTRFFAEEINSHDVHFGKNDGRIFFSLCYCYGVMVGFLFSFGLVRHLLIIITELDFLLECFNIISFLVSTVDNLEILY